MNLQQLERLFAPHTAQSSRILVNGDGVSRGVGFVRVRSRQAAQEVINKLNGMVSLVVMRTDRSLSNSSSKDTHLLTPFLLLSLIVSSFFSAFQITMDLYKFVLPTLKLKSVFV